MADQRLRGVLFAVVAVELGFVATREVARALEQALGLPAEQQPDTRGAVVQAAGLDEQQVAQADEAVRRFLDAAHGDAREALGKLGGLPQVVLAHLDQTVLAVGTGLADGITPTAALREAPPGRYVDFKPVGTGGMGIVYLALDSDLNRHVAFKIVNPSAFDGGPVVAQAPSRLCAPVAATPASQAFAALKARFLQEALITGHLAHPSIVPVYEVGQTPGGVPYYTMKFVRGERTFAQEIAAAESLEDRLGLLEPFLDLCDAVAYAHGQGVIHRDLKPGNVQRGSFGETVLLDWGLARAKDVEDEAADERWKERLAELRGGTGLRTMGVLGTPGYMAPETLGEDPSAIDERSDQYSLGVILFQILTGKLPHQMPEEGEPLAAFNIYRALVQREDAPSIRRLDRSVPQELADVTARALLRTPQDRYASVAELAGAIRAWQRESAQRHQRAQRRVLVMRTVATAAAALLVVVAGFLRRTEGLRLKAEQHAAAESEQRRQADEARALARDRADKLAAQLDDAYWEAYDKFAARHDQVGLALIASAADDHARESALTSEHPWQSLAERALRACPRLALSTAQEHGWGELAFARSGGILTAVQDGVLRAWDLSTGRQQRGAVDSRRLGIPPGQRSSDRVLRETGCLSPDGTLCVLWRGAGNNIQVVDVATGYVRATLRGITEANPVVGFSPDGAVLVTWEKRYNHVRLWDVVTGRERTTLTGHKGQVNVFFSPDGMLVASSGVEGTVKLWDIATGREKMTLTGHPDRSESGRHGPPQVRFGPDGRVLASWAGQGTICLWDVGTGEKRATLTGCEGWGASFSPDGGTLVSGDREQGTLKLWDVTTGREKGELKTSPELSCFCLSPDGGTLACGDAGGTITLWDAVTRRQKSTFRGHTGAGGRIDGLAFSPDGGRLASADRTIRLWSVADGREIASLPLPGYAGGNIVRTGGGALGASRLDCGVCFSPDGLAFATGSERCGITLWDTATGQAQRTVGGYSGSARALRFGPDGRFLASLGQEGKGGIQLTPTSRLQLWGVATGQELPMPAEDTAGVTSVAFSPDGLRLATGGTEGVIRLWDMVTGEARGTLAGHTGAVQAVSFSLDSRSLASIGTTENYFGRTMKRWDVATGEVIPWPEGRGCEIGAGRCVAFSPDGLTLAVDGPDRTVRLWDVSTGQEERVLRRSAFSSDGVLLVFSPDGLMLATAADDRVVRLWDVATGTETFTLEDHPDGISCVVFSPDGATLASGSQDGTVKLWDTATGQPKLTLRHPWIVTGLCFSPDGATLAAVAGDSAVRLWDLAGEGATATLEPGFGRLDPNTDPTRVCMRFTESGDTLVTTSAMEERTIKLWDARTGRLKTRLASDGTGVWEVGVRDNVGPSGLRDAVLSPDGATLAAGGKLWDVATGHQTGSLAGHGGWPDVQFSPDGATLAAVDGEDIQLLDMATGRLKARMNEQCPGTESPHLRVEFSADGTTLAIMLASRASFGESMVTFWDVARDCEIAAIGRIDSGGVLSPDGSKFAGADRFGRTLLWDVATGRRESALPADATPSTAESDSWCFSPDSRLLASWRSRMQGAEEKGILVWDVATRTLARTLEGHRDRVTDVGFSPDGKFVVSASADKTVRLWEVATWGLKETLRFGAPVLKVALSPDGHTLAALSLDGVVTLRDVERDAPSALTDVVRLTGCRLDGFSVAPFPVASYVASQDFVASEGHAFDPVPEREYGATENGDSGPNWRESSPYRWLPGARRGDAEALYRLAITQERRQRDLEAAELHRQAAGTGGAAPPRWADLSKRRLQTLPWLRDNAIYEASRRIDVVNWERARDPQHWAEGTQRNSAQAFYNLGLIRERQQRDEEAAELHRKAAAVTDPLGQAWVAKSRWRLRAIPWLRSPQGYRLAENARKCFERGDVEATAAACRELGTLHADAGLALAKSFASRLMARAQTALLAEAYADAEADARAALRLDAADPKLCTCLGLALLGRNQNGEAASQLQRAIALDDTAGTTHYHLASALLRNSDYSQALDHYRVAYERLTQEDSETQELRRSAAGKIAKLYVKLGRSEEAVTFLTQCIRDMPGSPEPQSWLAMVWCATGQHARIAALLPKPGRRNSPFLLLLSALCAEAAGDEVTARTCLRELLPADPARPNQATQESIGALLAFQVDVMHQLEAIAGDDVDMRQRVRVAVALGQAALALNEAQARDKAAAQTAAAVAAKLAPEVAAVHYQIGLVYARLEEPSAAREHLGKASALGVDANAHGNIGRELYRLGRHDEAMAETRQALAMDGKLTFAHTNAGLLHVLQGDLGAAMACYERGLGLVQDFEQKQKAITLAIRDLRDLLAEHPDVSDAHFALVFLYEQQSSFWSTEMSSAEREKRRSEAMLHDRAYVDAAKEGEFLERAKERLAISYIQLGHLKWGAENVDEAVAAYQKAVVIYENRDPGRDLSTSYADGIAIAYVALLHQRLRMENTDQAVVVCEDAVAFLEKLVADQPASVYGRYGLASAYAYLAQLTEKTGDADAAMVSCQKVVGICEKLAEFLPSNPQAKLGLAQAYAALGRLRGEPAKPQDAREWSRKAIWICDLLATDEPTGNAQPELSALGVARTRALTGQYAQAAAIAGELADRTSGPGSKLYELAGVFALAVDAVRKDTELHQEDRDELAKHYGHRAVALLVQARYLAHFDNPVYLSDLERNADFNAIRDRVDYGELAEELQTAPRTGSD